MAKDSAVKFLGGQLAASEKVRLGFGQSQRAKLFGVS